MAQLRHALDRWEHFLEAHPEDRLLLDDSSETRETASQLLRQVGDRELEVLAILAHRGAGGGWEYQDFIGQLRRRKLVPPEPQWTISRLEESAMIRVVVRQDGNGAFVAIEWPKNPAARLIYQLLRILH